VRIDEAVRWGVERLGEAGVPDERLTASLLLAHVLGEDRVYLIAHNERLLSSEEANTYMGVVARRAAGEPLQQIRGVQEFYGREFRVTPDVLIPRPESEAIVETAVRLWPTLSEELRCDGWIADLGTGSGCLAVTLALEIPGARLIGTDISAPALLVAQDNAGRHGAAVSFVQCDLAAALAGPFAMLACNLPYVPDGWIEGLQREVRHEPLVALRGGPDGLDIYRRLAADLPRLLHPDGYLICEFGFTQSGLMEDLADEFGLAVAEMIDDLQGIPRTVVLKHQRGKSDGKA
jgi:release factor glutamine methyltransferase